MLRRRTKLNENPPVLDAYHVIFPHGCNMYVAISQLQPVINDGEQQTFKAKSWLSNLTSEGKINFKDL